MNDYDQVIQQLKLDETRKYEFKIVRLAWLIDCNKNNCIKDDLAEYLIEKCEKKEEKEDEKQHHDHLVSDYECQRVTKLDHHNKIFTVTLMF